MLNNISLPGLLLIVLVTLVLFGRGKISSLMAELGTGLTAFRRGLQDNDTPRGYRSAKTGDAQTNNESGREEKA